MKSNCTVHGVMLEINGCGLLISGAAGVGKSELGLALVCMGHRLVADDVVELRRQEDRLVACRNAQFAGFIAVRDLGVVNLIKTHGAAASVDRQRLDLILELEKADDQTSGGNRNLSGRRDSRRILEVEVPRVKLVSNPGRSLASLAETAARDQYLRNQGYRADLDFETRQRQQIQGGTTWN